jgi:glycosyltransferase involved in cell wall biosynthesis
MSVPAVTVIVPVHNAEHHLPTLLDALERQTLARDRFEVLIVDDCSSDGTPELVERSGLARLLTTPERGGSYVARNVAVRGARAPVFAFTDADCRPAPDWLERGVAAVDAGNAELVAGHVHLPLPRRPSAAALLDVTRHLDQQQAVTDGFGATANLWVPSTMFQRAGLFNENLISGGDTEFCQRAVAAGAALRYEPDVIVEHPLREARRDLARKAYRLGYGAAQQRHHADGPLRHRAHICRRPGAYVPHWAISGLDRLHRRGVEPTAAQRMRMRTVQYLWVQLPIVAGNLRATIEERRRSRAGEPAPSADAIAAARRAG